MSKQNEKCYALEDVGILEQFIMAMRDDSNNFYTITAVNLHNILCFYKDAHSHIHFHNDIKFKRFKVY